MVICFIKFCASSDGSHSGTLHVAVLQQALNALLQPREMFLRMNNDGFRSVRLIIEGPVGRFAFVDALVIPVEPLM
ncbi:TPA: hypothetical protein N0F65_000856 [Lagenidium giganteum]|uniref:Uncharacterized protein n=1 Tax=Lagenidium giganteum TaxID=4803 RepID=A0AAV2YD60_9STRA|nr:TPA: hypothetical protein N0F65_000856 [Lagenidium giganteum]